MTFTSNMETYPRFWVTVSVVEVLELVGDVCFPLVLRVLEGLGIEYPCEPLKSMFADSATPVSDCRICLQVMIEKGFRAIERKVNAQRNERRHQLIFPETPHPKRTW